MIKKLVARQLRNWAHKLMPEDTDSQALLKRQELETFEICIKNFTTALNQLLPNAKNAYTEKSKQPRFKVKNDWVQYYFTPMLKHTNFLNIYDIVRDTRFISSVIADCNLMPFHVVTHEGYTFFASNKYVRNTFPEMQF